MDFMGDSLVDGSKVRVLNVIDDYNRQYLGFDLGRLLPSPRVTRALDDFIDFQGKPKRLRVDNAADYTSPLMLLWAKDQKIELQLVRPDKPRPKIDTSSVLTSRTASKGLTRVCSRTCKRSAPYLNRFSTSTITLDYMDR